MDIKVEFGYSEGPHGNEEGFYIWKSVKSGPAAGIGNIAWTSSKETAELITIALGQMVPKLEHSALWECPHCNEPSNASYRCNYCGTKRPEGN